MNKTFYCSCAFVFCALLFLGVRVAGAPLTDVPMLFTKAELEDIVGPLKPLAPSEDKSIVRYFPVDGIPYLEAIIIQVLESDAESAYNSQKKIMQKTQSYKDELPEFGENSYYADNGVTTDIHVLRSGKEITVSLSQSKPPLSKLEAAKKLMKLIFQRI